MSTFVYYLLTVNVIGFILFAVNTWLYAHTAEGQIDKLLTIASILGGSLGIIIAILLIDRKAEKGNLMSRVFVSCVFVIQVVFLLALRCGLIDDVISSMYGFIVVHRGLLIYLAAISVVTFVAFGVDKLAAVNGRSRIRNVTLLGLCFIGGSIGGLIAMYLFRHKTNREKNDFYTVGVPLMIIMQLVVLVYILSI